MLGASVAQFDFRAHGGEQFARGLDVAHLRNVFEDDRLVGEQGGGHGRQRGVLGAADADGPQQRIAAANYEFVHSEMVLGYSELARPSSHPICGARSILAGKAGSGRR